MSAGTPPSAKRRKLDLREEVVVLVGANRDRFTVPKAFLTKSSEFFKTCCNGVWKESETKTIGLLETEADTFSIYAQFLYTGTLAVDDGDDDFDALTSEQDRGKKLDVAGRHYRVLIPLAVFADKYRDIVLANAVNDKILEVMNGLHVKPQPSCVRTIYASLPADSTLRRMVVDRFSSNSDPYKMKFKPESYPAEFFYDMWIALSQERVDEGRARCVDKPKFADRCKYHEHTNSIPKTAECNK